MQTNICMIASTQTKQRRKRIKIVSDIGLSKTTNSYPPRKKRRWLQNKTKENKAQPYWPEVSSQKRRIRK